MGLEIATLANMQRIDDRQLCPGSDSLLPTEMVNPWNARGSCLACGQEVQVRLVEELWFLGWHLRQWESGPDTEALPPMQPSG
jgi:hypothetical protein